MSSRDQFEPLSMAAEPKGRFLFGLAWLIIGCLVGASGATWYFSQQEEPVGEIFNQARKQVAEAVQPPNLESAVIPTGPIAQEENLYVTSLDGEQYILGPILEWKVDLVNLPAVQKIYSSQEDIQHTVRSWAAIGFRNAAMKYKADELFENMTALCDEAQAEIAAELEKNGISLMQLRINSMTVTSGDHPTSAPSEVKDDG